MVTGGVVANHETLICCTFLENRARKEKLVHAMEHESNGNNATAYDCYQKAVDISPSVAYELIQVIRVIALLTFDFIIT